ISSCGNRYHRLRSWKIEWYASQTFAKHVFWCKREKIQVEIQYSRFFQGCSECNIDVDKRWRQHSDIWTRRDQEEIGKFSRRGSVYQGTQGTGSRWDRFFRRGRNLHFYKIRHHEADT